MSEYFPMRGICLGCQSGPTCDVHGGRAVLECERFEATNGHPKDFAVKNAPHYVEARTYGGLCRDCELRLSCDDAFRTGGVWKCDQYR